MEPDQHLWNSLEVVKIIAQILTPITMACFGWYISRSLKKLDLKQWSNQKLIEKRIEFYDSVASKLNLLLCFYTWIGDWKEFSPDDIIKAKRDLDKTMNVYRHLFEEELYSDYQSFIHLLFEHYVGPGKDARMLTTIIGPGGDRSKHTSYEWNNDWNNKFSNNNVAAIKSVKSSYYSLMNKLRASLGIIDKSS